MPRILLAVIALPLICPPEIRSETPVRRRAADLVMLKDQTRLFGVVVTNRPDQPVRMLVRRTWLEQETDLQQELHFPAPASAATGDVQWLQRHIEQLKERADVSPPRLFYLQECLTVLRPDAGKSAQPPALLLQIDRVQIARILSKTPTAKQLARRALLHNHPQTETATLQDLQRWIAAESPAANVPDQVADDTLRRILQNQPPKTSQQLQLMLYQADRRHGRTVQFLQYGDRFFLLSEDSSPEQLAELMTDMLQQQVQTQLSSLLNEVAGPAPGRRRSAAPKLPSELPVRLRQQAASAKAAIVEISRMDLNPNQGTAAVSTVTFHNSPVRQDWIRIAHVTGQANHNQVPAETRQQVDNDPRVRQVTQLFRQFGLSPQQLNKATSMGAVVHLAQRQANSAMQEATDPAGAMVSAPQVTLAVLGHDNLGDPRKSQQ